MKTKQLGDAFLLGTWASIPPSLAEAGPKASSVHGKGGLGPAYSTGQLGTPKKRPLCSSLGVPAMVNFSYTSALVLNRRKSLK